VRYEFYVPMVECGGELVASCERLHGDEPERRRRELTRSPLGLVQRVPIEPR
jgi:hypothetical protein